MLSTEINQSDQRCPLNSGDEIEKVKYYLVLMPLSFI